MSVDNVISFAVGRAAPIHAVTPNLLQSTAKLLRVSAAAFGEFNEPWGDADFSDVRETVRLAMQQLATWIDGSPDKPEDVFDALDVLTLVQSVLAADLKPQNSQTICPLSGAMRVAVKQLERRLRWRGAHS